MAINIYNTELLSISDYDTLISKIPEYDIYRYYINKDFKLNRIFSSPFRSDNHPSFGIFKSNSTGQLLYKDQATGDTGNCVSFVMKLFNINYNSAIKKIQCDLMLNKVIPSKEGKDIEKYKPANHVILVNKRNFTKSDDDYWNPFGITRDDLKFFNISPINYFIVDDVIKPYRYTWDNPMYAYFIFDKIKIYRPLADKADKWRSNAGTFDIQGYEQLPDKVDHLIITKSLKDVIVLRKLGYYAIAPNGENHTIPESIINRLRKDKGVKRFTVFYDNDLPGVQATHKLLDKYPDFYNIFIDMNTGCKDISDYYKNNGFTSSCELLTLLLW